MTLILPLPLARPQWEAFAQACSRGLSPREASEAAGYKHADRVGTLLARPEVVERINTLVQRRRGGGSSEVGAIVDRLIALADAASAGGDARAWDVARHCLADAGRLKPQILPEPEPVRRPMPLAEWRERFDPTWPGRKAQDGAADEGDEP